MAATLEDLIALLTLRPTGRDVFVAPAGHSPIQRVFGGRVLAQALVASGRTVGPDRTVHSFHAYFNRPGDPSRPITFTVERLRDGRAYTSRRTVGAQGDRKVLLMTSSFHVLEDGIDHQDPMPPMSAPTPDTLPLWRNVIGTPEGSLDVRDWAALDLRVDRDARAPGEHRLQIWLRSAGPLPPDPLLHAATLAYASDLTLLAPAVLPELDATPRPVFSIASLDHAMWFHRPVDLNHWLLHDQRSPSAAAGRGLSVGTVFDQAGRLTATTVQEGSIRAVG